MDYRECESKGVQEEICDKTLYEDWCIFRLSKDYPRVGLSDLRNALQSHGGKLSSTYKAVELEFRRAECKEVQVRAKKKSRGVVVGGTYSPPALANSTLKESVNRSWLIKGELKLLKKGRISFSGSCSEPNAPCPRFEEDWLGLETESWTFGLEQLLHRADQKARDIDHKHSRDEVVEALDFAAAAAPTSPVDDSIACGCCYGHFSFEELLQCADGHLFCADCLRRHFENYVFGTSSQQTCALPPCMDTDGCDKTFPLSQVKKAVPADALTKYEQRQAEVSVAKAKLEGLVYCPSCNHPWEVEPQMCTLVCENPKCGKVSCIECKEPDHYPKRCDEIEKPTETSLRTRVEELMTKAVIRECVSCRAELVKKDGCNKIVCRCGQIMCYVCRKTITDYSHFCQHLREPGQSCTKCTSCSLWYLEDEAKVAEKAKQVAMQEVMSNNPAFRKRDIGPTAVTPAMPTKKVRVC